MMKAIQTNFTALDLGSSKIAVLAAQLDSRGDAKIGYQGIFHSSGIKAGVITDFKQAETSIINAVYHLEQEISRNIKNASITLSGANAKSYYIYKKINLSAGQVTKHDIDTLIDKALTDFNIPGQIIIHYFPIEYTLDQNNSIQNPVGMFGSTLGCRLHIITANSNHINNFLNCFSNCHIQINEILLGIYVAGLACLTEDEKSLGSIVIDFGAQTTSFAVFLGGQLTYTGYIPIGSHHITSDIAKVLSISISAAEKLKVLYGAAIASPVDHDNNINLSTVEPNGNFDEEHVITAADLSTIINARTEEIIELIKAEYDKLGIDHLIARRIVLTGGGSALRGLKEVVSHNFGKQVRIGQPQNIPGFYQDHSYVSYSSVIGVTKHETIKNKKLAAYAKSPATVLNKVFNWLKENV